MGNPTGSEGDEVEQSWQGITQVTVPRVIDPHLQSRMPRTYQVLKKPIPKMPIIKEEENPQSLKSLRCLALCLSIVSLFIGLPLLSIPAFCLALYKKRECKHGKPTGLAKKYKTSIGLSIGAIILMMFIAMIIGLVFGVGIRSSYNSDEPVSNPCRGLSCDNQENVIDDRIGRANMNNNSGRGIVSPTDIGGTNINNRGTG